MGEPIYLGVEIGGTKLQLGLGRDDGRLLALSRLRVESVAGAEGIRRQIAEALGPLLAGQPPIAAAGVGFGGPVDRDRGRAIVSNQVEGWADFPIADWLGRLIGGATVAVENDADAAALGESRWGAGRGLSTVLYVTIGSGIGGGLTVDGRLYRGGEMGALEIGHLVVQDQQRSDQAGALRTLEQVASGWGLARDWRDRAGGDGVEHLANAARQGHPVAVEILADATLAMGRALSAAVNLLAPRRVILGGGVSMLGEDLWFGPIRRAIEPRVFGPFRGRFDVVAAGLGEEVVVHGALAAAAIASGRQ